VCVENSQGHRKSLISKLQKSIRCAINRGVLWRTELQLEYPDDQPNPLGVELLKQCSRRRQHNARAIEELLRTSVGIHHHQSRPALVTPALIDVRTTVGGVLRQQYNRKLGFRLVADHEPRRNADDIMKWSQP
jgi:hypothetical protein